VGDFIIIIKETKAHQLIFGEFFFIDISLAFGKVFYFCLREEQNSIRRITFENYYEDTSSNIIYYHF